MTATHLSTTDTLLFSGFAIGAPTQTGRCRPLLANGTLGAQLERSNPPLVHLAPGEPYSCELEFTTTSGQAYLGQADPPIVIQPPAAPGVTIPTAADAVTGLQASPTASRLHLSFTPPASPTTTFDGYTAICVQAPSPPALAPTRYLAVRGAGSPITVGGLLPGHGYDCSVQPYNAAGVVLGAASTFTTLALPPTPQPVPTLSGTGLLLLAPLTLLAALAGRRRPRA